MVKTFIKKIGLLLIIMSSLILYFGCGEEEDENSEIPARFRKSTGKSIVDPSIEAKKALKKSQAGLVLEKDMDKATMKIQLPKITETDFIESQRRRDPFKPFLDVLIVSKNVNQSIQRDIKLEEYDIEQLKLIAIITNVGDPRAMVVPPNGVGFILRRGDYVGKPDFVDPGSGAPRMPINWKVHRIHGAGKEEERGMYLVRDDPLTPTLNDIVRFMPLYPQNN